MRRGGHVIVLCGTIQSGVGRFDGRCRATVTGASGRKSDLLVFRFPAARCASLHRPQAADRFP